MTRDEVINDYFAWLYDVVCSKKLPTISYRKLLMYLHDTEFVYEVPRDRNRAADGEALRYRFALMQPHEDLQGFVMDCLDAPCSVLELMIGLALRCEEQVMDNPKYGDRSAQWFWNMIVNMGLGGMTDAKFNKAAVEIAVNTMMYRAYDQDGRGGLFTVEDAERDMRGVELWVQMLWYTNTIS